MTYDTLPVPIPVSPADSDILTFSDSPSWSPASFASSALPITPQTKDEARLAAPPPFSPRRTPGSSHFHYSGAIAGDARYHYNRALEALTKDRPPAQRKEDYSSRFKE
ncbi:hypothetical protein TREMEDRAFT_56092, partial [Tremella mesenterica DSM 1558]|uniref:uncharacterized protein n=1 Tax=Tremella mesenterica (strain ATCC 24925 / CBS 8224 / DSM 1558 / NBRC 9311 / NRRL Y-6157 / RJB 2259-6 / UBC 559-6) TaxID=578456 RepID=UPI0003F48FB6